MGIYSSIGLDEPDIRGLDYEDSEVYYKAVGDPIMSVGVATACSYHDHVRLGVYNDSDKGGRIATLLPPSEVLRLINQLTEALRRVELYGPNRGFEYDTMKGTS